jgi:hypothetical protein
MSIKKMVLCHHYYMDALAIVFAIFEIVSPIAFWKRNYRLAFGLNIVSPAVALLLLWTGWSSASLYDINIFWVFFYLVEICIVIASVMCLAFPKAHSGLFLKIFFWAGWSINLLVCAELIAITFFWTSW